MPRRAGYEEAARGVARYLAQRQRPDGSFPGPDSYGVASAVWLWSHFGAEFADHIDRGWRRLRGSPPGTHGEFNAYALLHSRSLLGADRADRLLRGVRFGRRHSANWMLLRSVCRALPGPFFSPARAGLEARAALLRYGRHGLIADRRGVRSFAYHAFSGALLADLWRQRTAQYAARAAVRAADFIIPFVLPSGDAMYVGRGQQQVFGYGALLYLLEAAAQIANRPEFGEAAGRVFQQLRRFQRHDGSFPLVLREGEALEPWHPDASRPGWYTYNRYADYLPFLGCMLLKAAQSDCPRSGGFEPPGPHPAMWTAVLPKYVAVLSCPGGAPTNDLCFPYVCVRGESLFPCYGSEGDTEEMGTVPLPYGVLAAGGRYPFRRQLTYRLAEGGLLGASRSIRHLRRFEFSPGGFVCQDEILFKRDRRFADFVPANFLFRTLRDLGGGEFETWHRGARARLRLAPEGSIHPDAAVTASGSLVALRQDRGGVAARRGDALTSELRVRFL